MLGIQQKTSKEHPIIASLLTSSLLISATAESVSKILLKILSFSFFLFSLPSLLSFLINPIIMFVVIYLLGRKIDVTKRYVSIGISLFLGGLIGSSVPYFVLPELFGSHLEAAFASLISATTSLIALAIILLEFGISTLLYGFFAVSLASFRHQKTISEQVTS